MQIARNIFEIHNSDPYVCALGNFDGLHYGHRHLLETARKIASQNNCKFAVMTFEPHPAIFFKRSENIRILPLELKLEELKELDSDMVIIQDFDNEFAQISAKTFVEKILLKHLNIKHIVIGHDFIFGRNRTGNAEFLNKMAKEHNFGFTQISSQQCKQNNLVYSSSEIRKAIKAGNMRLATSLMGREYTIFGQIKRGNNIGKELGYQTANIDLADHVRPKYGVYAVKVIIKETEYHAVANFGLRPTVIDSSEEVLEIHIFDFNETIYGELMKVSFIDFIRQERKFASKSDLVQQIANDCDKAKMILAS
jgi:riboflavin kinase/FMN adenylyltransferase